MDILFERHNNIIKEQKKQKGGEYGKIIESITACPVGYPQFSVDGKRRKNQNGYLNLDSQIHHEIYENFR